MWLHPLRGRAAWAHDFDTDRAASARFQTLPGMNSVGAAPADDAVLTTPSAEMKFISGVSLVVPVPEGETGCFSGRATDPRGVHFVGVVCVPQRRRPMVATDKLFAGSIPEVYDQFLVPLIFEPYARDLAERIAGAEPHDLLETAAGTGALTTAMVSRLPKHTRLVATDLNQPMLDRAATKDFQHDRVTWRQADALALPFDDQTFDVVACQVGVMFFPERVKGYREARRVLKPRGRFVFNVWDRIAENEFADVVTEALAKLFPQDPPLFMIRTPHGYHEVEWIREDLAAEIGRASCRERV